VSRKHPATRRPSPAPSVALPTGNLRRKLLTSALGDPAFRDELGKAAAQIRKGARPTATEATVESYFERVLYATLRDIGLEFNPEKEVAVDSRRHIGRGRMDSRLGALVIEYKRPSKFKTSGQISAARKQLEDYLLAENESAKTPIVGFLTDGRTCLEVRAEEGSITARSARTDVDSASLARLVRHVVSLDLTALTAENLIRDFCGQHSDGVLFQTARVLNAVLSGGSVPKTDMLRSEWEELFKLAHEDQSQQRRIEERRRALEEIFAITIDSALLEYRALFALHTAYAIVLKLIAYRVVADLRFGSPLTRFKSQLTAGSAELRAFCEELEDGEIFRELGILNLLEGDFFSWYSDRRQWNGDVASCVRQILQILARYEDASAVFASAGAIDLFRGLYERTVPRVVRASFGEFYTPTWLAEHVLGTALRKERWRALDPCCGSGTFLVAAIQRIRRERSSLSPAELLVEITDRVAGIDLNPLAVLTSRVNYFIHVCELIETKTHAIVIPVYLGDASYVPEGLSVDGVPCLTYRLRTLRKPVEVTLPASLVRDTAAFVQLMLKYEDAVRKRDLSSAVALLIEGTSPKDRTPGVLAHLENVSTELVNLESQGWNGIWARILTNFFTTALLGRFEAVVGNPPWIDWKNLPALYREKIKSLCLDRGLFSGAGRTGGINLNICALIAHVSISNWLSTSGRFAFLMPRELSNQPSYEGWRRLPGLGSREFLAFHDWSGAGHPFDPSKEDFMTYLIGPKSRTSGPVPAFAYTRRAGDRSSPRDWRNAAEAMTHLAVVSGVAGQLIPDRTAFTFAADADELRRFSLIAGPCHYIGREGIEFYPQELLLFRYVGEGPKPGTALLENVQVEKSKYRIPRRKRPLETRYLFPLVKGPAIRPFKHDYQRIIVPFPYASTDPHRPVPADVLQSESDLLLKYFRRNEAVIKAQTKFSDKIRGPDSGEFYGLARTGPYSFRSVYVGFRDNTRWCAAVITRHRMPWGERKRFVFQNHAVSMCEAESGRLIGLAEAHYICAILNAPSVERFIHASSDARSFNIRPPVYVPEFNPADARHKALYKISRRAHSDPDYVETARALIDRNYLRICSERRVPEPIKAASR